MEERQHHEERVRRRDRLVERLQPLSRCRADISEAVPVERALETGFFNIKDEEVVLYRIRDISMKRTLGQRIFGVGTITVVSSDKSCPKVELKNVKKPRDVKEMLHKFVEEMKINRKIRITLQNGEQIVVSRMYSDELRRKLGLR